MVAITLTLTAFKSGGSLPDRIEVADGDKRIAAVYCDQVIEFYKGEISLTHTKQVTLVAENFYLFFNNLTKQ
jgi:hypothetical protein